jgi:DNA-binding transcriptional ArsR family regulator
MKRVTHSVMDTGEVMEGAVLGMFFPKRQNGFREGWLAMAQDALMAIAKMDLGDEARRLLFAILAKLDYENYLLLNQAEIGEEIGMQRANVSRALAKLEGEGILLRGPKAGRSSTFRLNPSFGWKGSASNHQKALRERMKAANIKGVVVPPRDPNTVDLIDGLTDSERR